MCMQRAILVKVDSCTTISNSQDKEKVANKERTKISNVVIIYVLVMYVPDEHL